MMKKLLASFAVLAAFTGAAQAESISVAATAVQKAKDKRIVIVHGAKEHSSNLELTATTQKAFEAGNKVQSHEHAGGHAFQADWETAYRGYLDYALGLQPAG